MTETIANGNTIRVPLLRVDGAKNEHIFSFMSITWGLIADIDRGSEPLRFLSSSRFDIASILYIISNFFTFHISSSFFFLLRPQIVQRKIVFFTLRSKRQNERAIDYYR
ncbi:hypothetical protein ACOME3_006974 [Neoechinorhynchus agilis]